MYVSIRFRPHTNTLYILACVCSDIINNYLPYRTGMSIGCHMTVAKPHSQPLFACSLKSRDITSGPY